MNREFKFRVWDEENKKFYFSGEHLGCLCFLKLTGNKDVKQSVLPKIKFIQQFTGLKDKNGREIYEGDILKDDHDELYLCEFQQRPWSNAFHFKNIKKNWNFGGAIYDYMQIIGNIFETPELLK